MERAASSTLPHPSGFGASALQGGTRLSSSSCSGSPISGAGSALLMQVWLQAVDLSCVSSPMCQSVPALGPHSLRLRWPCGVFLTSHPLDTANTKHATSLHCSSAMIAMHSQCSPSVLLGRYFGQSTELGRHRWEE
eukprot:1153481-Pelagomonas_calceolata.AAC.1